MNVAAYKLTVITAHTIFLLMSKIQGKPLIIIPTPFPCTHTQFMPMMVASQLTMKEVFIDDLSIYKALSYRLQSFDQTSLLAHFPL